jgi:hypothetical protein
MYSAAIILQEYLDSVKRNNWLYSIDFALRTNYFLLSKSTSGANLWFLSH